MLAIKKDKAPEFFESWIENKKEFSHRLREYILEREQVHVCCYCEKKVDARKKESHIDHIRPRDTFPKFKNKYENLVVSCETKGRCGKAKGKRFSKHFIVPTEENPADYLTYSLSGELRAIDNNKKAGETIDILNLNAIKLVKARRTLFIQLQSMRDSIDPKDFEKYFEEYPTCIRFFRENY